MSAEIEYLSNRASWAEIAAHLAQCDADFVPPLSTRVDLCEYARKIEGSAMRFEAWSGGTLAGLLAAYCNDREGLCAYVTSVSVLKPWAGRGIAARLLNRCVGHAKGCGMRQISLEVSRDNAKAIRLYRTCGFVAGKTAEGFITMNLPLVQEEIHEDRP